MYFPNKLATAKCYLDPLWMLKVFCGHSIIGHQGSDTQSSHMCDFHYKRGDTVLLYKIITKATSQGQLLKRSIVSYTQFER